jgi:hypothetical protein
VLAALAVDGAWLLATLYVTLDAALDATNGTPPEWLFWPVMLLPVLGGLALIVAAASAAFERRRTAWAALYVAVGSLASWGPLALLLGSNWS